VLVFTLISSQFNQVSGLVQSRVNSVQEIRPMGLKRNFSLHF